MNHQIKTLCHQGPIRSNNEDAILYGENNALGVHWMVIADGMGGHNAGEVASKMLVEHVEKACNLISSTENIIWNDWITEQLNLANLAILQSAELNTEQQGMGTTGVLIIIDNHKCHIGWVGDSRAYSFIGNKLHQETIDHTMLQELVNKGAISAETAQQSNTKNLLSQAIGVQKKISVDTKTISINNGDIIMLSTDGLHDYLTEQEINLFLSQSSTNDDVCDNMVNTAIEKQSRDNLTIGLLTFNK